MTDPTLHQALAAQGIASTECQTPNKRRLYLVTDCRELGEHTAAEAWEGLRNGFLVYSTELTPEGEQTVIPGCERVATADKPQLSLF